MKKPKCLSRNILVITGETINKSSFWKQEGCFVYTTDSFHTEADLFYSNDES